MIKVIVVQREDLTQNNENRYCGKKLSLSFYCPLLMFKAVFLCNKHLNTKHTFAFHAWSTQSFKTLYSAFVKPHPEESPFCLESPSKS
jgi:hypothetical protein